MANKKVKGHKISLAELAGGDGADFALPSAPDPNRE
jgi:hypothetical protein